MAKILITTDSTCDLPAEITEKYNIHVVPLNIEMDGESFRDGLDVQPDDLYDYYARTGKLARSSACSIGDYEAFFRQFTDEGYQVVHVGMADYLSTTLHSAQLAAEEVEGVFVVNSRRLSTGIGLLAIRGAELIEQGLSAQEIAETLEADSYKADVSFVLNTLEYMCAGGRCSSVAKFGANLLKIKPQIVVYDHKMDVGKKPRGKLVNCIMQYIEEQLSDPETICTDRIFFTHSGLPQEIIDEAVANIRSIIDFKEVIVTRAGCVISCHCGPGTGGVLFMRTRPVFAPAAEE